jgi:hypothetical protein
VVDRHLLVSSEGEHLGRYPLAQTLVERVSGNRFRLTIGNEVLEFAAEDAIGFSYEAMPAISQSTAPMRPRAFLDLMTRRPRRRVALDHQVNGPRHPAPIPLADMPRPAPVPEETPSVMPPEAPMAVEALVEGPGEVDEQVLATSPVEHLSGSDDPAPDWTAVTEGIPAPPPPVALEPVGSPPVEEVAVEECRGLRGDGTPCGSVAIGVTGYCFAHDPDLAGERKLMNERVNITARRARATDPDLEALVVRLESAVAQVHEGTLDPQQALAMASLVQAMCDTIGVSRKQR